MTIQQVVSTRHLDLISDTLNRRFESDIISLDFANGFDSVCPAKLVSKPKAFGIGDPLLKWF